MIIICVYTMRERELWAGVVGYVLATLRQSEQSSEDFVSFSAGLPPPLPSPLAPDVLTGFFLKGLLNGFCLLPEAGTALAARGLDPVITTPSVWLLVTKATVCLHLLGCLPQTSMLP